MAQVPTRTSRPRQLTSRQTDDTWESVARNQLPSKELHFIVANVRERGGGIDLIMREGNTTVFVEVRYRCSAQFDGAAASMIQSRQHKLLQTARLWLVRHNGSFDIVDCRFDVLAFTGNDIKWLKDTFNDRLQLKIQSLVLKDQRVRQNQSLLYREYLDPDSRG